MSYIVCVQPIYTSWSTAIVPIHFFTELLTTLQSVRGAGSLSFKIASRISALVLGVLVLAKV